MTAFRATLGAEPLYEERAKTRQDDAYPEAAPLIGVAGHIGL